MSAVNAPSAVADTPWRSNDLTLAPSQCRLPYVHGATLFKGVQPERGSILVFKGIIRPILVLLMLQYYSPLSLLSGWEMDYGGR